MELVSLVPFQVRVRHRLRPPLSLTLASCLIALAPSRKHALLFWLGRYTSPSVLSTELDDACFVQRCFLVIKVVLSLFVCYFAFQRPFPFLPGVIMVPAFGKP